MQFFASKIVRKLGREMSTNISSKCVLNQIWEIKVHPWLFFIKNVKIRICEAKAIAGIIFVEFYCFIQCQLPNRILILERTSVSPIEILKMNQRVFGTNRELLILGSIFKYVSSFQRKKLKLYCLKIFVCCKKRLVRYTHTNCHETKFFWLFLVKWVEI